MPRGKEVGGPPVPAFRPIRTAGAFTDGFQAQIVNEPIGEEVLVSPRQVALQPIGEAAAGEVRECESVRVGARGSVSVLTLTLSHSLTPQFNQRK